jgi:hypothetical protein
MVARCVQAARCYPKDSSTTMANHLTNSQIQTLLAVTPVSALTAGQLKQLVDSLQRVEYVSVDDANAGTASDPTLAVVFPSAGNNP